MADLHESVSGGAVRGADGGNGDAEGGGGNGSEVDAGVRTKMLVQASQLSIVRYNSRNWC